MRALAVWAISLWILNEYLALHVLGPPTETERARHVSGPGKVISFAAAAVKRKQVPLCRSGFFFSPSNKTRCLPCPPGTFSFPGWLVCMPRLTCTTLMHGEVRLKRFIGAGAIKQVYLAEWRGVDIAYAVSVRGDSPDFAHNLRMLERLGPSEHVNQLIGSCQDRFALTEYATFGDGRYLDSLFRRMNLSKAASLQLRMSLAMDYVSSLVFLHNSPAGVRVMCDGNDIQKLLSQYLVTDDFRLVVNDLDALPEVVARADGSRKLVKCGHRQLFAGGLVAPEQVWPFGADVPFNDRRMPGYDEKVDIWRIPDITRALLGESDAARQILAELESVHLQCKKANPHSRPEAKSIIRSYEKTFRLFR